jgi:hypothetical protein
LGSEFNRALHSDPEKAKNIAIGGSSAGTCQANPDISVTARRRSVAQQLSRRTLILIHFRVLPIFQNLLVYSLPLEPLLQPTEAMTRE